MATKKMQRTVTLPSVTSEQVQQAIIDRLYKGIGTDEVKANNKAWWNATCQAVNELVFSKLTETQQNHSQHDTRAVNYLSLEFLMGRLLANNLQNLQVFEVTKQALKDLGKDIYEICDEEPDMALGNGGLGRLAACFIDSLATLGYPAIGYGIHYEHGLFKQEIQDGRQIERPDTWREYGNPWEICRPESIQHVPLYGYVETVFETTGSHKVWHAGQKLKGVPWDIPIVGYGAKTVNILRLWESRADEAFDWDVFNAGGYVDSQVEKSRAETVSKVLYPNDSTDNGKELRLIQQYFFCACSVKDILRRFKRAKNAWERLPEKVAIQLNDTHPTMAIPELMRILVDEERLEWDFAWDLCQKTFAYTNHTLLPEALEKWSVALFEKVLPRHLEIIYEINSQFLEQVVEAKWPGDDEKKAKLSVIEESQPRMVRMANLCVITAYKVNGVAAVHSELVKKDLFPEFHALFPEKLVNVTNGVTPRRWLKGCNPGLSTLLDETLGEDWVLDLDKLKKLKAKAKVKKFQKQFMKIKRENKERLIEIIKEETGVYVSADAIFDIQIKRLHEYKRQQLNLIHILTLYRRLLEDPDYDMVPRVFIFGAKAAPGYHMAKEIIFAINKVADKVNNDIRIKDKLKVVFLPNYRVSLAEFMFPAADVSEQISTAGLEASGTGNMKFALNGALTIGTMDGANIEMAEEIGADHMFIFGLSVDEVKAVKEDGYTSYDYYYKSPELKEVLDWLDTDFFTPGKPGLLGDIKRSLLEWGDEYLCLADYDSYVAAHKEVDRLYRDQSAWAEKAILNVAGMGKFNSDRSIEDYVKRIWHLEKFPLK